MSDLHHECGLAAIYHLPGGEPSPLCPAQGPEEVSRLMPRMLLDIQNRGQLSAGMTAWNPSRSQLLATYKEVGSVSEVFRMNHRGKYESLMEQHAGRAAIGHVRYATCGAEDRGYAQPLERPHIQKRKWFAFGFNGQLANYQELRAEILAADDNHLARDNDTEVLMHVIGKELSGDADPNPVELLAAISARFDGAWNIAMLDACGRLIVARDPLGIRPMEYACLGSLVAAASESVALLNLGFSAESIRTLEPGTALIVDAGGMRIERFAESPRKAKATAGRLPRVPPCEKAGCTALVSRSLPSVRSTARASSPMSTSTVAAMPARCPPCSAGRAPATWSSTTTPRATSPRPSPTWPSPAASAKTAWASSSSATTPPAPTGWWSPSSGRSCASTKRR
jgi:asparagine synthetase B (glutamine-hydrolysing)